jgi:hypothetical protein
MQVYEQLGTDKPHQTEGTVVKEEKTKEATRPLSPTDVEEKETQPTIDVRSGETQDNVQVKTAARETPRKTETPTPGTTLSRSIATAPGKASVKGSAKKGHKKKNVDYKPYLGIFEANLKMQEGATAWEIRDLRGDVPGGEKTWTERAFCLMCSAAIE